MADESSDEVSTLDISKLKVPDLKKELKNRGLSTSGNKNELVERLQSALKSSDAGTVVSIDDIEEDLLNDDDDDEHIDERESFIADLDTPLEDLPKQLKRKSESDNKSDSGPPKKVILKRNTSETLAAIAKANEEKSQEEKNVETKSPEKVNEGIDDKKVIKFSDLSVKERLDMRAKKFGVTALSDNVKKLARAERFGSNSTNKSSSAASIKLNDTNTSIDVLKQRAARFGGSVSSVMSKLESKEKMEKRKERFSGTTTATNGKPSSESDTAKAARLERFKTSVK